MIPNLKPYPVMKDSGVEWLGEVPEHWEARRIKTLFREKDQRSGDGQGMLLSLTRARGIVPHAEASDRIASASDLSKYKVCRPGELVMNRMQAWSGMFAVSPLEGLVSPDYSVFGPTSSSDTHVKYFEHLFKTPILVDQFAKRSKGIGSGFNRLYTPDFGSVPAIVPPLSEQAAIVRYLDHVDRRVRRVVRAKQKLIGLLEEQKQAIIHRAVTRGLDPDVPLKPSGVEWLGEVPEHWEVTRLRHVARSVTSGSRGWSAYAADHGPLFIRIANLRRMSLDLRFDDVVRLNLPDTSEVTRTRVQAGDLLVSITAYIGSIAVVPEGVEEAYVSQHVARCSLRDLGHNPWWLGYVLLSEVGQTHGQLSLYGGTKDGLSLDDVKNYPLLLPPRSEQDQLVAEIERRTSSVNGVIDRARREIELLREYRTCLIADVVTGKLDVREAAANLPEAAEETELIEDVKEEETLSDADEEMETVEPMKD